MSTTIQSRRGTTAEHSTFTGAVGEITVDTTKDTVVVHDNLTAGGHPMAKEGGSATVVFNVEAATADDHAVSRVFGDSRYAQVAGSASQGFSASSMAVSSLTIGGNSVLSGTYTPSLTNTTNVAASTAYQCQYIRVENVVTVSGQVAIDPTAAAPTATVLGISLPIASNFSGPTNAAGTFSDGAGQHGRIQADTTNDTLLLTFNASNTANALYSFQATYWVQ
jgi:hypothetical protein